MHQIVRESHLCDNCIDAHRQNHKSRIGPCYDHKEVADQSGYVPVEPVAETADIGRDVRNIMNVGNEDTDAHQVRKEETWVERQATYVM